MTRNKTRRRAHKVARKLKVTLPGGNLPLGIKLIALFTVIGGLSIMGGIYVNFVAALIPLAAFIYLILNRDLFTN